MKFIKIKNMSLIVMLAISLWLPNLLVKAEDETRILEHFTSTVDNTVTFYLNYDASTAGSVSVTYGNTEEYIQSISDISSSNSVYTLILIDNSQSVMRNNHDRVMDLLKAIMENKASNEKFFITEVEEAEEDINYSAAVFSDDIEFWYSVLDSMEIENKDADIFLNMSKAIKFLNSIGDTEYKRILIVSDGIHEEEESAYYSKDEIDKDLEKTNYPIYAIGVLKNTETTLDLQNLFSYARKTGGAYYEYDQNTEQSTILDSLGRDSSYLKIVTAVENQPCDGAAKNVQLNINGLLLNETVALPVVAVKADTAEVKDVSVETESIDVVESIETEMTEEFIEEQPTKEKTENKNESLLLVVILGTVGLLFVIVLISLLLVIQKRKKNEKPDLTTKSMVPSQVKTPEMGAEPQTTALMSASVGDFHIQPGPTSLLKPNGMGFMAKETNGSQESEGTMILSNNMPSMFSESITDNEVKMPVIPQYKVILKNLLMPGQEFSGTFKEKIIIGRNPEKAELVIPDRAISGAHCEIGIWNGQYYIKDLKSSNGSYVNGTRCDDPTEIQNGCQILLGRTSFQVVLEKVTKIDQERNVQESAETEILR